MNTPFLRIALHKLPADDFCTLKFSQSPMFRLIDASIDEIVFLRGSINYTEFHLTYGRKIMSSYTLLYHENQIHRFLRISKSYLVNPDFIEKINSNGKKKEILLKNGICIKVSRRRRQVLKGLSNML